MTTPSGRWDEDWPRRRRRPDEWQGGFKVEREAATPTDALDVIARRLGLPTSKALGGVFGRWSDVVGPQAAAHSRPVRLRQGTLVVAVDHPAWATSLRHLRTTLLARLDEVCGTGTVTEVDIRVEHAS